MRRVDVTGGIRTGKNKFSNIFAANEFPAADGHLFDLGSLKKCIGAWKKVGSDSSREKVRGNGEADRLKQGRILFDEPPKYQVLNRAIYQRELSFASPRIITAVKFPNPWWVLKNFNHSSVSFVISQGKPKFEIQELDPGPLKKKWKTTKKLKLHRKKEKQKRKAANKRDPKHLGIKAKRKFANVEDRIKYKLENAKIKEALLIDRLKRYEVDKVQGPLKKPVGMTGEERFYLKKMAQKSSNYAPVGKRGIFGGVILNMHMHWKKHETVKVICKPCKPGQIQEYANEIARLSGGIPIQVIGNDTIIFYRGKDYVQPEVMSPIDTLSKKRALEKSKYEQSLETVRHFIAIAEKELELYHKHIALYGEPINEDPNMVIGSRELTGKPTEVANTDARFSAGLSDLDCDSESEENELLLSELESENECEARNECDSSKEETEDDCEGRNELNNSIKNCMFYR